MAKNNTASDLPVLTCRVDRNTFLGFIRGLYSIPFDGPVTFHFQPGSLEISSQSGGRTMETTGNFAQVVQLYRPQIGGLSRGGNKSSSLWIAIRLDPSLKEFSVDHWGGKAVFIASSNPSKS